MKPRNTPEHPVNPAIYGLTDAENEVYQIICDSEINQRKTITTAAIQEAWQQRNRTYVYRIVQGLIDKKLVERYSKIYYRLNRSGK